MKNTRRAVDCGTKADSVCLQRRRDRLNAESVQERESRLQEMRVRQCERLATKTSDYEQRGQARASEHVSTWKISYGVN